ncbi:hypothetical protein MMC09_000717 [Bachmanniomyces sp. S44760]|nr:hypothetical protein [Bachmanniomyces sp. S44760]
MAGLRDSKNSRSMIAGHIDDPKGNIRQFEQAAYNLEPNAHAARIRLALYHDQDKTNVSPRPDIHNDLDDSRTKDGSSHTLSQSPTSEEDNDDDDDDDDNDTDGNASVETNSTEPPSPSTSESNNEEEDEEEDTAPSPQTQTQLQPQSQLHDHQPHNNPQETTAHQALQPHHSSEPTHICRPSKLSPFPHFPHPIPPPPPPSCHLKCCQQWFQQFIYDGPRNLLYERARDNGWIFALRDGADTWILGNGIVGTGGWELDVCFDEGVGRLGVVDGGFWV